MSGWVAVAGGGALGALLRYGVTVMTAGGDASGLPWHTLGVNVLGSFMLGLLMATLPAGVAGERWRLFAGVGVLGGFTTFSTFSVETVTLVQHGAVTTAAVYMLSSLVGAVLGAAAGYAMGRAL